MQCTLDFVTSDLYGTPTQGSDGNILMEFVLMERLWADSSGQDSYDPYTCAVNSALFLECLDIAGPRTLGNSLSDSVAYNMSGSAGDLNKNFYAVLALEGLLNMTGENVTGHFGGDVTCSGKVVGDGAVNAYDMATLMWYQFRFEPYDQLSRDPSTVATVQGRDDTGYRCNLGETRRMWQLAVGDDYCHKGQNAQMLGYDPQRRLAQGVVAERSILSANIFDAYRTEPARPTFRQLYAPVESVQLNARETRAPSARRASINSEDMLRNVNAMRTLDIDVAEWGSVDGYGRWIRLRAPGVQVAMELYLAGISVDQPVHLSLQSVPTKNCTSCQPVDEDPRKVVIAFARRTEYEDEYASAVSVNEKSLCANIVPATVQSSVMLGNTIAVRQQPPNRACGFDIFIWVPSFPASGIHVSKHASPYSFAARRLASVGAESALVASRMGCDTDIGVLAGSSAMDGFRGQIQRAASCTRYGFTQPEVIKPVTAIVPAGQCSATPCNVNAPARSQIISRSFHMGASSGMERAYTNSLQLLTVGPRRQTNALRPYTVGRDDYVAFETALARDSQGNNCCAGYVCAATGGVDDLSPSGTCTLQYNQQSSPVTASPRTPPSPPSTQLASPAASSTPMLQEVVFGVVVDDNHQFNQTDYIMRVSVTAGVPVSCISLQFEEMNRNVTTTIRPELHHSAESVKTALVTAFNIDPSAALGVTVVYMFAAPEVHLVHYAPSLPPPSSPPASPVGEDNAVLVVLLVLAGILFLAVVACVVFCNYDNKEKATAAEKEKLKKKNGPSTEKNVGQAVFSFTFT